MFSLPLLPYGYSELSPVISEETLQIHHGKHHKAYVDALNSLISNTPFDGKSLEEIIQTAPAGPIFNNAAQIWNHTFYFESLAPVGKKTMRHETAFSQTLTQTWKDFDTFRANFKEIALKTFGSGWVWLVKKPDGSLAITSTSNAATPITTQDIPLLTCDVWEHAYYVDYRNRRADYVEKFFDVINWEKVEERFNTQI